PNNGSAPIATTAPPSTASSTTGTVGARRSPTTRAGSWHQSATRPATPSATPLTTACGSELSSPRAPPCSAFSCCDRPPASFAGSRSTRCSTGGQGRPILPGKAHSRCDIGAQANRDVTLDRLGVPHQLGQLLETFDERLPYLGGDVGIGRCRRRGLEPEQEMRPMLDTLDVELMNAGLHLHRVHDLSGRLDDRHDLPMVPPMAGEEQILLAREQGVDVRLRDVGPFGDG